MSTVRAVDPSISRTPMPLDAQDLPTVCVLCSHNCGVRVDVEGDRRAYRVRLTPKGRKLFHEMAVQHERWIVEALGGLSERDMGTLYRLLGKVKNDAKARQPVTA